MTQDEFETCVDFLSVWFLISINQRLERSVKIAILDGIHPKMISKGSSGSYFARAKGPGGRVRTVA